MWQQIFDFILLCFFSQRFISECPIKLFFFFCHCCCQVTKTFFSFKCIKLQAKWTTEQKKNVNWIEPNKVFEYKNNRIRHSMSFYGCCFPSHFLILFFFLFQWKPMTEKYIAYNLRTKKEIIWKRNSNTIQSYEKKK